MMIDQEIKKLLGYEPDEPDGDVIANWKRRASKVCKPCWEIKYCPYGPWVEYSPLLPMTIDEALDDLGISKKTLETEKLDDGSLIDESMRSLVEKIISEHPKEIPSEIKEMECSVFGHICPVTFIAEDFTETAEKRRSGRYIPFSVKMRVVRRDSSTCQECGKNLLDNEVEFDHIIPVSKGGSAEESNIRLTCFDCNRDKSNKMEL
jgi:hypothetical protein